MLSRALIILLSLLGFQSAYASFDIEGFVQDNDGNALPGTYKLWIEIQKPGDQGCILYREEFSGVEVDTTGSFVVTVGNGAQTIPASPALDVDHVLKNQAQLSCYNSSGSPTGVMYTPGPDDVRVLSVEVALGSTQILHVGTMTLKPVPYAVHAKHLGRHSVESLLRVEEGSEPKTAPALTQSEANELKALAAGTSDKYLKHSAGGGVVLPGYSGPPAAPMTGSIWFDLGSSELKYFDGTTVRTVGSGGGGGSGTVTSITAGAGLTGGTITTSGTIALEDIGSPGTYYQVTTDAKGRVTSGKSALDASDIPDLDWAKITTGKPTTVAGYGITDAVKNAGGIVSIQAGNEGDIPAPGTAGRIYVATDTQKIYRDDGTSWVVVASVDAGGGGSVTEVTVSGAPLSVTNGTTTPQISISQAGPGSSGYLSKEDWNTFNSKLDSELNSGQIFVGNSSNVATAQTPSGDVSMNESGVFTVIGLRGTGVSGTTPVDGQVLKFIGAGTNEWVPSNFSVGDLKTSVGVQQFAQANCAANQTLTWSSLTDTFACVNISGLDAAAISSGTIDIARIPIGTTAATVAVGNDARFPSSACGTGNKMRWDGSAWKCEPDSDSGGTITGLAGDVTASGSGIVTATVEKVGGVTADNIANVVSLVNNASHTDVANAIVRRDSSGKFAATEIHAGQIRGGTGGGLNLTLESTSDPVAKGNVIIQPGGGNVGIGTSSPVMKLEVAGGVKIGNVSNCIPETSGTIRWTGTAFEGCQNGIWVPLSAPWGITSCPSGWTMIGDPGKVATFCIETNERGSTTWLNAHSTCNAINDPTLGRAHLCTYGEWRTACERGTGLSNMTNNWEWVDEIEAASNMVAFLVGSSGCTTIQGGGLTSSAPFRCCLR